MSHEKRSARKEGDGWPGRRSAGVSICVINRDQRPYLSRSVASALAAAESLRERRIASEVLVLDDKSRDGSQRFLAHLALVYGADALHPVLSEVRRGRARIRNRALREARYKWVCLLDADDELMPRNLTYFHQAISATDAALVYGSLLPEEGAEASVGWSSDVVDLAILEDRPVKLVGLVDADKLLALGSYCPMPEAEGSEDRELVAHLFHEDQLLVFVPMVFGRCGSSAPSTRERREGREPAAVRGISGMSGASGKCRVYDPRVGRLL